MSLPNSIISTNQYLEVVTILQTNMPMEMPTSTSIFQRHVYQNAEQLSFWASQQLRFTACEKDGKSNAKNKYTPVLTNMTGWKRPTMNVYYKWVL